MSIYEQLIYKKRKAEYGDFLAEKVPIFILITFITAIAITAYLITNNLKNGGFIALIAIVSYVFFIFLSAIIERIYYQIFIN